MEDKDITRLHYKCGTKKAKLSLSVTSQKTKAESKTCSNNKKIF